MGQKIIKLAESDLVKIVQNILEAEQNRGWHNIEGTTDPTSIVNVSVLQNKGLPCDESNFKMAWTLGTEGTNNLHKTKNLSGFVLANDSVQDSLSDVENYISIFTRAFTVNDQNKPELDRKYEGEKMELRGSGTKTFNTFVLVQNTSKTFRKYQNITAKGNGLLALARALDNIQRVPNQITIAMGQETRVSSGWNYDPAKINNLIKFAPNTSVIIATAAFGNRTKDEVANKFTGGNYTPQQYAESCKAFITTGMGAEYIPRDFDTSKLPAVDVTNLVSLFQKLPDYNNEGYDSYISSNTATIRAIVTEIRNLYGMRVKSFLKIAYPDKYDEIAPQINPVFTFDGINSRLKSSFRAAEYGRGYGQIDATQSVTTQGETSGTYERGK